MSATVAVWDPVLRRLESRATFPTRAEATAVYDEAVKAHEGRGVRVELIMGSPENLAALLPVYFAA